MRYSTWVNGDTAIFGSGSSTAYTVSLNASNLTASGLTFNSGDYTIAPNGTYTLTLANSSGTVDIALNADATISAPLQVNNNLLLSDNHSLTLATPGSITFASGLTLTIGTGSATNVPSLLSTSTGYNFNGNPTVYFNGGTVQTFDIGSSGAAINSLGGAGIVNTFDANGNSTSDFGAAINQTGAATFELRDGTINVTGNSSGTFTNGTLQIGNNALATTVVFGYQVGGVNNSNLPASNVTINLDNATLTQASSNITINSNTFTVDTAGNTIANNITLTGSGDVINGGTANSLIITGAVSGTSPLTLNSVGLAGNNTYSGGTIIDGGGAAVGSNSAFGTGGVAIGGAGSSVIKYAFTNLSIANSLTLAAGSNDIINMHGNSIGTWSGVVGGAGALTVIDSKNTGGQLTLSGANTYTGGTTVGDNTNSVSLNLTGSLANSNVTILSHAGLTGTGTLNWNLANDTGDLITAQGGLTISGLHLDVHATGTQTQSRYIVANYTGGTLTGTSFASVLGLPTGWSLNYGTLTPNEILLLTNISAPTLTWDPTGAGTDGGGTWDTTTANWNSPGVAWTNGDFAAIGNGGTGGTINIDGPVTVAGLTFNTVTSPYTISATGTGALNLTNSAGIPLVMNASATISAPVTFNNSFTVSGNGTLALNGNTSFVGTDSVQIGTGSTSLVPTLSVAGSGGGSGNPAQIIFDSGTFEFSTSGAGFNQPVISTDNGTVVTNTFDAGGATNSQDISSSVTQSHADTFVLQDGTIYLTAANSSTFTAGTLQIGNGSLATTMDFGYNGSNNLPANGVTLAMNNATLTQASSAGPNGETVDTSANTISNAMTLAGANTINTGTLHNLTIAGNIADGKSAGSLTVNGDGVSIFNLILTGTDTNAINLVP
ncbi:MAG: beta strand repeat-containing protein [Phycisphaerae bacterium]